MTSHLRSGAALTLAGVELRRLAADLPPDSVVRGMFLRLADDFNEACAPWSGGPGYSAPVPATRDVDGVVDLAAARAARARTGAA